MTCLEIFSKKTAEERRNVQVKDKERGRMLTSYWKLELSLQCYCLYNVVLVSPGQQLATLEVNYTPIEINSKNMK